MSTDEPQKKNEESQADSQNAENENNESHLNSNSDASTEAVPTLEEQLKAAEQKYLYLYAEFENFKKRIQKEKNEIRQYAWEGVAMDLLSVLDNLGFAIQHAESSKEKAIVDGIKMVHKMFEDTLNRNGVTKIPSENGTFDPNLHEASGEVDSDLPEGQIVAVQLEGYQMHGRLLRPARVTVSNGKHKKK